MWQVRIKAGFAGTCYDPRRIQSTAQPDQYAMDGGDPGTPWNDNHGREHARRTVAAVRVENPDMPAGEMAQQLSGELGKQITPDSVRKTLERARVKFADLLVAEVATSLETSNRELLEAEMRELNLSRYCQAALERRK